MGLSRIPLIATSKQTRMATKLSYQITMIAQHLRILVKNLELQRMVQKMKYYRHNRLGHTSKNCTATETIDGRPPREPKKKQIVKTRKFVGPYKILSKEKVIYKLLEPKTKTTITRHVSKLKKFQSINSIMSTLLPLTICILAMFVGLAPISCSYNYQISKASLVAWQPTPINDSKTEYEIQIKFEEPCWPMFNIYDLKTDYNYTFEAEMKEQVRICRDSFQQDIIGEMDLLVQRASSITARPGIRNREKKSILTFFGGLFLSNIIETAVSMIWDDHPKEEAIQRQILDDLNSKLNFSVEAILEISRKQDILAEKINELYKITDTSLRRIIRLQFGSAYLASKMAVKNQAIKELRHGLANKMTIDIRALGKLLDTTNFENIDSDSIRFMSLTKTDKDSYTLKFYANTVDTDMQVLEVKTFPHWIDLATEPKFMEYNGPKHVLFNTTNDCVRGLNDLSRNSLSSPCLEARGRIGKLNHWVTVITGNPFESIRPTVYYEVLPDAIVYCLDRKIKIEEDVIDCPPYPISIPANHRWSTSDVEFNPYTITEKNFSTDDWIIGPRVNTIHLNKNHDFIPANLLKQLLNVTSQLEAEKNKNAVIPLPARGITFEIFMMLMGASLMYVTITIIAWKRIKKSKDIILQLHEIGQIKQLDKPEEIKNTIPKDILKEIEQFSKEDILYPKPGTNL